MPQGRGVFNSLLDKLPVELHLTPSYNFCGPGTKLQKRLARGDVGINPLDDHCRVHDIAYSNSKNLSERHAADKILQEHAWQRVKSKDAKFGERAGAFAVAAAMKIKRTLGMGLQKKKQKIRKKRINKVALRSAVVQKVKNALMNTNENPNEAANVALGAARVAIRSVGGRNKIRLPRIIPIPKQGGILPLIPIFAALSALGALSGGAGGIAKAINDSKSARKGMEESQRHNKTMEAIALGKKGSGLYLKPYRKGLGLYLSKPKN